MEQLPPTPFAERIAELQRLEMASSRNEAENGWSFDQTASECFDCHFRPFFPAPIPVSIFHLRPNPSVSQAMGHTHVC
jgi:hypothetical protein